MLRHYRRVLPVPCQSPDCPTPALAAPVALPHGRPLELCALHALEARQMVIDLNELILAVAP